MLVVTKRIFFLKIFLDILQNSKKAIAPNTIKQKTKKNLKLMISINRKIKAIEV